MRNLGWTQFGLICPETIHDRVSHLIPMASRQNRLTPLGRNEEKKS